MEDREWRTEKGRGDGTMRQPQVSYTPGLRDSAHNAHLANMTLLQKGFSPQNTRNTRRLQYKFWVPDWSFLSACSAGYLVFSVDSNVLHADGEQPTKHSATPPTLAHRILVKAENPPLATSGYTS